MRMAWLTPASGTSGIVEFSRQVVPALAAHVDIELWSHGPADHPPAGVPVIDYGVQPDGVARLRRFDAVIYNLGNHLAFHRPIYEASLGCPGIAILHDRTLQHFFAGYYIFHRRAPALYIERMTMLYGPRGHEVATAVVAELGDHAWNHPEEVIEHAFIEDALATSIGAVVHSSTHADSVRARWGGPVLTLSMPAYGTQLDQPPRSPPVRADGLITLMSIGHVEHSKQIHTVVEALAGAPDLAQRVRYLVIGQYDPHGPYLVDLNRTIADAGLARTVTLLGYMPSAALERYAATADVFINIRSPNFESGSASLLEQLARRRAIVVYDSGAYADLPDDAVVKVAPGDHRELAQRLHEVVRDRALRERLAAAARHYAESRRVSAYAQSLVEFAQAANERRPHLRLADRVGDELRRLGVDPGGPAVARIGAELDVLLGEQET